jgi:hypothetical protein
MVTMTEAPLLGFGEIALPETVNWPPRDGTKTI